MKKRLKYSLWLVLVLFAIGTTSCKKCKKDHMPIMPYFVSPDKDSIKIGDTLWLEARMPFKLRDWNTDDYYNYKNAEFYSYFEIREFNDTSKYIFDSEYSTHKFNLIKKKGDYITDGAVCRIYYLSQNDSFFLKVGLVAKDTGFYSINLSFNPGGEVHGLKQFNIDGDDCKHTISSLCQSFNNGKSTLYRAKKRGITPYYSINPDEFEYWIYNNRIYFFTVVK